MRISRILSKLSSDCLSDQSCCHLIQALPDDLVSEPVDFARRLLVSLINNRFENSLSTLVKKRHVLFQNNFFGNVDLYASIIQLDPAVFKFFSEFSLNQHHSPEPSLFCVSRIQYFRNLNLIPNENIELIRKQISLLDESNFHFINFHKEKIIENFWNGVDLIPSNLIFLNIWFYNKIGWNEALLKHIVNSEIDVAEYCPILLKYLCKPKQASILFKEGAPWIHKLCDIPNMISENPELFVN